MIPWTEKKMGLALKRFEFDYTALDQYYVTGHLKLSSNDCL